MKQHITCSGSAVWSGDRRRGVGLLYGAILFALLVGFASFAVDLGAAQLVKTQLQRTADATAHDYIVLYNSNGKSYANTNGPASYSSSSNPVNLVSGAQPTYVVTWGYWNSTTKAFATSNNGGDVAVKVVASCTKANGNAVPLLFASVFGTKSVDVAATAISISVPSTTKTMPLDAMSDIYFAGMSSSSTSTYGDNAIDNPATEVNSIPVTPGDILTFTNMTGTSSVYPPGMPYVGPEGTTSGPNGTACHHGVAWWGGGSAYTENGVADAVMPESALVGMFLDDNAPNSTAAPSAVVDWTDSAVKDKASYSNLTHKSPFYIGDGQTNSGTVQQFTVPAGATRFYIGLWDGLQYNNNDGSISLTITTTANSVRLVQ